VLSDVGVRESSNLEDTDEKVSIESGQKRNYGPLNVKFGVEPRVVCVEQRECWWE